MAQNNSNVFEITTHKFDAVQPDSDQSKIVRVGAAQMSIVAQTSASVSVQRELLHQKVERVVATAAANNVNILCLHELWSKAKILKP